MCTIYNKPVIDVAATAKNLKACRMNSGFSVREVQSVFNFLNPQAIYNWESGNSLPTVDNLLVLAALYRTTIEKLVVTRTVEVECEFREKKSA